MYENKIHLNELLTRMNHILERMRYLSRSKSFKKDQIEKIDYHLTEIMKILNDC
jgi:hypothetical protein